MKFQTHIAFNIHTFYHQNFKPYLVRLVCHFHFYVNNFISPLLQNNYMQQIELPKDAIFDSVR